MHPRFFPLLCCLLQLLAGRALGANTKKTQPRKAYTGPVDYSVIGQDTRKHLPYQQQLQGFAGYGKCDEARKM